MEASNKLIAEFMKLDAQILSTNNVHSWSDAPFYYITEDSKEKVMEGVSKYSKYHTSWDWLMPVVDKIKILVMEDDSDELYNSEEWDNITHTLVQIEIKSVYQAVVEFIKNQNN